MVALSLLLSGAVACAEEFWAEQIRTGNQLREQGRYSQAEEAYLLALKRLEALPEQNSRLATTMNNLAAVCQDQGKFGAALDFYHSALVVQERFLGPQSVQVATTLSNLGALYHSQGKYDDAEALLLRSVALTEAAPERDEAVSPLA